MEAKLPDFCSLGTEDLLGLALDPGQEYEAEDESQDLVQPGVGASTGASQPGHKTAPSVEPNGVPDPARTFIYAGLPGHVSASDAIMTTQELDSELRHLPLDSEPQPGSEPQPEPFSSEPVPHVAVTQSGVSAGSGHSFPELVVLPDTLDTAALDAELRELPLETQDPNVNTDGGTGVQPMGGGQLQVEVEMATVDALEPQSFNTCGIDVGIDGVYTDSQELNDELRALPIESVVEDDMQPPPVVGAIQGGVDLSAPEDALKETAPAAASAQYEAHDLLDPDTVPQREVHDLALRQHQPRHAQANRLEPSSWDAFDDFGGAGSFEDDLEDYLAAQAADAQQVAMQAPKPRQLEPPDLDGLDDLIAELECGGRAPSARPSTSKVIARALDNSSMHGTIGTGSAGVDAAGPSCSSAARTWEPPARSQETVHQCAARQAKRPRIESRGRPTMEELFGSDEEDEDAVMVASLEAVPGLRCPADAAGGDVRDCGTVEEDEAAHPSRPSYFPPQRLASRISDGVALPVTAASGERVYCRVAETTGSADRGALIRAVVQQAGGDGGGARARRRGRGCFLEMPLVDMLRELDDRQLRAAVAASEREERRRQQQQPQRALPTEEKIGFADMAQDIAGGAAAEGTAAALCGRRDRRTSGAAVQDPFAAAVGLDEESMLWVDKYAPRHFMSLLSDERTNRQVALWVKDWDECVFGRMGTAGGATGTGKVSAARRKVDSRPQHKVLLIGGPPGLGKTTLAHVVARHCGYHPYEINASDDRTASTLLTRIQDAVQMTAVLGGGRPNCVIVDEVDGATGGTETGGAVAALLKLIRAGEGATAGGGAGGKAAVPGTDADGDGSDGENEDIGEGGRKAPGAKKRVGGRQGSQRRPLCRPIICICNDLYAPALRPLRDVARVFHFSAPASERLTARLAHICKAERLEADPAALRLLVERTDRDVRACLNTLQFLARRGAMAAAVSGPRRTIDVKDIETLNIASKDTTQSAMDMWTLLLSTGSSGRKRGGGGYLSGAGTAPSQLREVCNRLQDFGDYDLVLSGLHENLPRVRFMDINLNRTAEVEEAMGLADVLLRSCRRTGDFSSLQFVPPLLAKVRALAAQPERPRQLAWPRMGAEAARRTSAAAQLVRSWASSRGTDPGVIASHGITVMMLELAPALRALASQPPIRAVAPNMMTADEQATLRRTADIMLHYGLRYCFELPTPPGLQPLQLPEVVAPASNNAIILGLTAEVQKNIVAATGGDKDTAHGFQRQIPQPYGGRGPSGGFQAGRGGRGQYNSYGQGRGPGGNAGYRGSPDTVGHGAAAGAPPLSAPMATGKAPANPTRHVPLVPAIDTLYVFTAFRGKTSAGATTTVPHVVRQMISQQTEMEAIRRAEAARMAASTSSGSSRLMDKVDSPGAEPEIVARTQGPLQPVSPPQPLPPQRQMAGRMPSPTDCKKSAAGGGGCMGNKRKGTWMDAFKQQASAKARGNVGEGASAGATARQAARPASGVTGGGSSAGSPQGGVMIGGQGRLPFPVLYRFNEGYTNAVKRPLLMRELI
ncbi:hypothetical protein VaNZ11_011539 [Volvox africanus]|uniref:AAA+ ATPase domain-containing protein n=1 Tax=Volvox africanus TaxID=51714 RepID=A0ABQ5SCI5_9CHLO|nr:hypothetical protein VaNZ11_011539 [Volvox africanus]